MFGAVRISAYTSLAQFHFEDPKIAQFDGLTSGQTFDEMIQSALNDVQYVLLNHSRLIADANHQIALG